MASLELRGVEVLAGQRCILQEVDLVLPSNDFAVITGSNGSGKSSLLHVMAGILKPGKGKVLWNGNALSRYLPGTKIGIVFQESRAQILGQSVEEDIQFGLKSLKLKTGELAERSRKLLAWSGLEAHAHQDPHTLSGGEQRRLAIAGILALEPEILLLDEPFSGLDWHGTRIVLEALLGLYKSGIGICIVCHDLDKVLAHANRLILMKDGRIITDALPERVLPFLESHGVRRPGGKLSDMSWLPQ